ncbi:MAG: hypothetical protein CMH54_10570 [Myxococcales bacterium]|nr:hypothetical protein [Myxococcales bacterium]
MTRKMTLGFSILAFLISGMLACGSSDNDPVGNAGTDTTSTNDTAEGTDEGSGEEDITLTPPDEGNTQPDEGTTQPPVNNQAECQDFALCVLSCAQTDTACQGQCQTSFPNGSGLFNAINTCAIAQCGNPPGGNQQDPVWSECINAALGEGGACFQARIDCGLVGTGGCMSIVTCSQTCADQGCLNKCVWGGDGNAQALYMAFNDCVVNSCNAECVAAGSNQTDCAACQQEKCISQIQACQSDM